MGSISKRLLVLAVVVAGLAGTYTATSDVSAAGARRVIVTLENGAAVNEHARGALVGMGGKVLNELPLVNGLVVLLPSEAAVGRVGALHGVRSVETDARVFAAKPPDKCTPWPDCKNGGGDPPPSPAQVLPWGVDYIDAELAWATSTGAGIRVAVLDTGIDRDHPDLSGNLKGGVNFVSSGGPPWNPNPADPNAWNDDNGHGTHVAGTVAALNNSEGVVGVAPGAWLYAVKVLDKRGSGYASDIIAGLEWTVANGMQVANLSLGTTADIAALHDAVDAAYAAGVVIVAAAGNNGDGNAATNEVLYPAKYSSVVAVSAVASDGSTPYWSSEGTEVELAAPGVAVLSTWNDGGYNTISGTSMASPHVSGVMALALSSPVGTYDTNGNGVWDPAEARAALNATADDMPPTGHDNYYGWGIVDAELK